MLDACFQNAYQKEFLFLKCYSMYTNKNHIIHEKYFIYKKQRLDYYLTSSQTMCNALFNLLTHHQVSCFRGLFLLLFF